MRRIISQILAAAILLVTVFSAVSSTAVSYRLGDVNGDGKINGTDYLRIRGAFLKTYTLSDEFLKVADVNGDGRINGTDYLRVRGHYLGTYNLYK